MALYDAAGDHAKAIGCYGTGVRIKKTASDDIQCAISFDQVMANNIGNRTRFPSLELGLDYGRMEGGCDPGYACIYSNNVSWKDAKTPAIKEVNPRVVFDRLFGGAQASDHAGESRDQQETYNRSILDYTRDSLTQINTQLGQNDRHRVDEYLTGIREIEHRLDAPPSNLKLPKGVVRPTRVPDTFKEHFRLMSDLQILAFQMDATRISTFMLGVEQSRRTYNEIGIPEEHHGLTHHAGDPAKIAKVVKIDTYMAENFAYYLDKMKSVKEGHKTMLDNAMVLLGNGNGFAARHDHDNCLIGAGGQGLRHARSGPLCQIRGRHADDEPVAVADGPDGDQDGAPWRFHRPPAGAGHDLGRLHAMPVGISKKIGQLPGGLLAGRGKTLGTPGPALPNSQSQ